MARLTLEQLGPLIKKQRGSRGLRQVAAEMNISAATLSRVEAGKQPDLESFTKICAWLGINPGEFLGYTEHEEKETASKPSQNQTVMLAHFKAGKTMSPKTAQHLGELILAIHQAAIAEDDE
ncbi:helix-turn-helix domain-containing protein [Nostoc sp. KVJ3]|uniref:helix-turn-helix domain-containing protein n=1 Tax=Nostoc sp. KVJ3 TaxID=457945 RepID=UPI002238A2A5|nr:helix-turn-helix transcriptional regulator [Nostoc sp. KVJ3]MCW5318677.1 helix-turn-helix domain-containing protein [Nostoc sp. KVJ3]